MGHTSPPGSIRRLIVLELGSWLAAPGAAALLADLGADVIKVEPTTGDPGREFLAALGGDCETTPPFALLNRGKRSVVIDLTCEAGRERFERLLVMADVFITNMRPGSLERLSLGPDDVLARFPRLIYASITGLGLRGPERESPVYDVGGFWARSGLMSQLAVPGSSPPSPTGGYGDIMTSLAAYAGIVSALLEREWTGKGGLVECSLLQTGAFVNGGDLAVQAAHGHLSGQAPRTECKTPLVNAYFTSDDRWLFLTGIEARRHLPSVASAIGRPEIVTDPRFATSRLIRRNCRDLIEIFDSIFRTRTLLEWSQRFEEEGVCWQSVRSPPEVLADPQLSANEAWRQVGDGSSYTPMVTSPFRLFRRSLPPVNAPRLGEHDEEIFSAANDDPAKR